MKTHEGMEVAASGNPGVPVLDWGVFLLAGHWIGGSMSGSLLGELHVEDSTGISNIGFDKSSSISPVMLGPMSTLMGHSVMECGEETSVNDHRGMAPGESP